MNSTTISSNVTLSEISRGALEEHYQAALAKVLANIDDPNTSEKAKREIKISLVFHPKQARDGADVDIKVETKLVAPRPVETFMSIKKAGKDLLAFEPEQPGIFDAPKAN